MNLNQDRIKIKFRKLFLLFSDSERAIKDLSSANDSKRDDAFHTVNTNNIQMKYLTIQIEELVEVI